MKHILAIVGQIKKLIATVREENVASWKTIKKAAFQFVERKCIRTLTIQKKNDIDFMKSQHSFAERWFF